MAKAKPAVIFLGPVRVADLGWVTVSGGESARYWRVWAHGGRRFVDIGDAGGGATPDEIAQLGAYVIRDLAAAIVRSGARLRP